MSFSTLRLSGSSMRNVQESIDTISHNIANVNTDGYKKKNVYFESVVGRMASGVTYSGTAVDSVKTIFTQGAIKQTGSFTDMALKGQGFFTLQSASGNVVYSRSGHFSLDGQTNLVDPTGNFVLSTGGGKITLPSDVEAMQINSAGEILIKSAGSESFEFFDQIQLANFANPESLEFIGNNLYRESTNTGPVQYSTALGQGTATANTTIVSGSLESSNVNLGDALVELIGMQRSYQAVSKAVTTANDLLETTIRLT